MTKEEEQFLIQIFEAKEKIQVELDQLEQKCNEIGFKLSIASEETSTGRTIIQFQIII